MIPRSSAGASPCGRPDRLGCCRRGR
jgi:hypothetical protein